MFYRIFTVATLIGVGMILASTYNVRTPLSNNIHRLACAVETTELCDDLDGVARGYTAQENIAELWADSRDWVSKHAGDTAHQLKAISKDVWGRVTGD